MRECHRRLPALAVLILLPLALTAAPPALNPDHPESYRVQRGDTLWDISGRFLAEPWRWKEIWEVNPQIENPHLIFPGDTLRLSLEGGTPRLVVDRAESDGPRDLKLSPGVRREALTKAIPTIPIDAVQQFLTRPRVMDRQELETAPYLVAFVGEHIVGGAGDDFYVRAIDDDAVRSFDLVRPGNPYRDPDSGDILGYEAEHVGDAQLLRPGDPAKLRLAAARREAQIGDRVLPDPDQEALQNFQPRPAPSGLEGRIIEVFDGVNQIGQYDVVVLNRGSDDGLEPGSVLRVYQGGALVRDLLASRLWPARVELPLEDIGVVMVFRSFSRVSFALVMRATHAMHLNDWVRSPEG